MIETLEETKARLASLASELISLRGRL